MSKNVSNTNLKIDIQSLENKKNKDDAQRQLVQEMWKACNKLSSFSNPKISQNIQKIQIEIKQILATMAEEKLDSESPLASSKKTDLQKCLAQSNCEKAVQKQFESSMEQSNM